MALDTLEVLNEWRTAKRDFHSTEHVAHEQIFHFESTLDDVNEDARLFRKQSDECVRLMFLQIRGDPLRSRARMVLKNISDRTVKFRFRCSPPGIVAARGGGVGEVEGLEESQRTFIWRREDPNVPWGSNEVPRLRLVTQFVDELWDAKQTTTEIFGIVGDGEEESPEDISQVSLILDSGDELNVEPTDGSFEGSQESRLPWASRMGFSAASSIAAETLFHSLVSSLW